jgi:hypothetical protein
LPTATDNDGHLVNYIEVPAASASAWDPSSEASAPEPSRHQTPFGDIIPPHLLHSALLEEQYLSQQLANPPPIPHPAALPRHLDRVILNTHRHTRERAVMDGIRDDNSVLPIPNHVVLNHLGTSAIKNGVLAVATTMRYHQKVLSLPLQMKTYLSRTYSVHINFILQARILVNRVDCCIAHGATHIQDEHTVGRAEGIWNSSDDSYHRFAFFTLPVVRGGDLLFFPKEYASDLCCLSALVIRALS